MSHEVEIRDGKGSMVYFGETPWHKWGQSLNENEIYDLDACITKARADFECEKVPLQTIDTLERVDHYAVRRTDTKAILGTVGKGFTILQNRDAWNWFKPFLESQEAHLHTGGVLQDGRRIWVLAKLNRDPIVVAKGDEVEKFVLLSHAHDGSLAVRVGFTPIRVVCANTLAVAHQEVASKLLRCKHTKNLKTNLENIRETMNLLNAEFEATAEQYKLLAQKDINQKDVEKFVKKIFKVDEADDFSSSRQKAFNDIQNLLESGKGNDLPGVKGTWWAAYNAVTEYLSYSKAARSDESRLNSLWYGQSADLNKRALDAAIQFATAV